ncbi:Transcriptional regulator WhiB [Streptomyces glaucescens]
MPPRGPGSVLPDRHLRTGTDADRAGEGGLPRCPVREPCLEFALDTGQTLGVWGGTGEAERRALQRRRKARHTG